MNYFSVPWYFRTVGTTAAILSFTYHWIQPTGCVATGKNVAILPCSNENSGKSGSGGEGAAYDIVRSGSHCQSAAVTVSQDLWCFTAWQLEGRGCEVPAGKSDGKLGVFDVSCHVSDTGKSSAIVCKDWKSSKCYSFTVFFNWICQLMLKGLV